MLLFSELKRRNVFRVALLYIVASWLMLQVTDVGVSLLGLPPWTGKFVFFILLIGFPLVLLFSWAYEITPEGLKREKDVDRNQSITTETAHKLNKAVIVLLVLAIGSLLLDRMIPEHGTTVVEETESDSIEPGSVTTGPAERSIAVLPFVNMSADADNEYFSDGLSEELLNLLAKIPELRVAARTSTFAFKNVDADITEIADKLNVAHVLEGSVRKSGDNIRITAQLIKASDGYHMWSETWDRTLVDVFAIQDEIASAVVAVLKVSLLGEVPHARETDTRAYELYLQGKALANLATEDAFEQAALLLTDALAIDPQYAEGWTTLSNIQTNQAGMGFVPFDVGFERARTSAERALSIDPTSGKAMSNLGWNFMYYKWDFASAAQLIGEARRLEPGNASILNAWAVLQGVFGRRSEMINYYEIALERDPVAMSVLANLSGAYMNTDRLADAAAIVQRMQEVSPDSAWTKLQTAFLHWFQGDTEQALDQFLAEDEMMFLWGRAFAYYDLGMDRQSDETLEEMAEDGARPTTIALVHAYRNDFDTAFEWLERAYEERDDYLIEIRMYKGFETLHDDPRWTDLLTRIGISDADAEAIGL
jgi:TolB-like protein/Flp pilus assembly protein TadD